MYIHIGEDLSIRINDIIAIVDKQCGHSSVLADEEFLKRHNGNSTNFTNKSYKSIVITNNHVYLSPYSSSTLKKRSNFMNIPE